jgi:hypothetical protein
LGHDQVVIGNRLIQLANTIAKKIDPLAIAAAEAALSKYSNAGVSPGHNWGTLVTVGPLDQITPSANRPTADIANAALLARIDDLGVKDLDTPAASCSTSQATTPWRRLPERPARGLVWPHSTPPAATESPTTAKVSTTWRTAAPSTPATW